MSNASDAATRAQPPTLFRWTVLVMVSLAMAGNYYVYDSISPLADLLRDQLGLSDDRIGTLNGIYSVPNIFMVAIGGLIIDRIGTRRATLIFGALCSLGALITALTTNFFVMAAGRLVFGLGAESMIVAVTTALAIWFRGKELSFAFGVNLTIARLGSFAALNSPTWAKALYAQYQWPLWIAVGIGSLCVVGPLLYWGMERGAARRYDLGVASEPDKIVFREIFNFGRSYWFVVALCVTFYSAMFPFQTFAVKFFQDVHGVSRDSGGFLSSMLTLFAMICTPLFGLAADRFGKRATLMLAGSALIIPVYLVMAYTRIPLYLPMAAMGIAFSLIPAVMWPSVAYIVDQRKLGTALGVMTMVQNIGLAGYNFLIGWANTHWNASAENPAGYVPGMWMFTCLGVLALFFALLLRLSETGANARGLETITTRSSAEPAAGVVGQT
ncbi:MAG: MFS transporter [Deltaproteobacteria bacterium]|nr:MFS transporter [Deltaproteobacteria bacterium]